MRGFGLLVALAAGGCLVPWLNFPFILFALAPLAGGMPALALALIAGRPLPVALVFAGFRTYERFLGIFWVGYLLAGALCLPLLFALAFARHFPPLVETLLLAGGGLFALAALAASMARWLFVLFVAAEAGREVALDRVLETASRRTAGRRWRAFGWGLGALVLALSGALLAGVGLLLTVPLAAATLAALYRGLAGESEVRGAWYPAPARARRAHDEHRAP